jgi:hypothetical protein
MFQHSVCKIDDRTDCNNYLVVTFYQLQNTTPSNTLLSSLTAHEAELVLNQEYGFGLSSVNVWERCFTYTFYAMLLCRIKSTIFG